MMWKSNKYELILDYLTIRRDLSSESIFITFIFEEVKGRK